MGKFSWEFVWFRVQVPSAVSRSQNVLVGVMPEFSVQCRSVLEIAVHRVVLLLLGEPRAEETSRSRGSRRHARAVTVSAELFKLVTRLTREDVAPTGLARQSERALDLGAVFAQRARSYGSSGERHRVSNEYAKWRKHARGGGGGGHREGRLTATATVLELGSSVDTFVPRCAPRTGA